MIFVDANVFVRFFTQPPSGDPNAQRYREMARDLFQAVEAGDLQATTTEIVLHEVCHVLGSGRHYRLPPPEIAALVVPIISLPGFKFPKGEKAIYLRAFEISLAYPRLRYADSLIAARAERLGIPLATFDEALGRLPFLTRWAPPTED